MSALPSNANLPVSLSDKNAATSSKFKNVYLSLRNLESQPSTDETLPQGTKVSPPPTKKGARTDPNSSAAVTSIPSSTDASRAARALTIALSSRPSGDQPSPYTPSAKTSTGAPTEPAAQHIEIGSTDQAANVPAPSLGERVSLPPAVRDSNFNAPIMAPTSERFASAGSAAKLVNTSSNASNPVQVLSTAASLIVDPRSPQGSSSIASPAAAEPRKDPRSPQVGSSTASPEPAAQAPIYQSATAKFFVPATTNADNEPQKDANPRRVRTQSPVQAQSSTALTATPSEQASAPPPATTPDPPAGQQVQDAKLADPSSTASLAAKSLSTALPQNTAFSLHLENQDSSAPLAQAKPQPADTHADASAAKREDPPAASSAGSSVPSEPPDANLLKEPSNSAANLPASEVSAVARPEIGPAAWTSQPADAPHVPAAVAVHDAQPVLADSPKLNLSGEILLHLQGNDQSSAAIRVVDRAGSVNVSVHASDTELRNALRSNVGELVSQLNGQGWKAEVDKPGISAARAQTSQDPQADGQRSPGQQQSSNGSERQPQRDRRSGAGRWIEELQQQTSGQSGNPGGKN